MGLRKVALLDDQQPFSLSITYQIQDKCTEKRYCVSSHVNCTNSLCPDTRRNQFCCILSTGIVCHSDPKSSNYSQSGEERCGHCGSTFLISQDDSCAGGKDTTDQEGTGSLIIFFDNFTHSEKNQLVFYHCFSSYFVLECPEDEACWKDGSCTQGKQDKWRQTQTLNISRYAVIAEGYNHSGKINPI